MESARTRQWWTSPRDAADVQRLIDIITEHRLDVTNQDVEDSIYDLATWLEQFDGIGRVEV